MKTNNFYDTTKIVILSSSARKSIVLANVYNPKILELGYCQFWDLGLAETASIPGLQSLHKRVYVLTEYHLVVVVATHRPTCSLSFCRSVLSVSGS